MKKKKIIACIMLILSGIAFVSCGDDKDENSGSNNRTEVAVTGSAQEVTDRSAQLTGILNLELITISYTKVKYGIQLSPSDDFTSPIILEGSELVERVFKVNVSKLDSEKDYWYRTYVVVQDLKYFGQTRSFTTKERGSSEAVDLGLPSGTRWAKTNVGADKPEEHGLFFAWGETTGYTNEKYLEGRGFSWAGYKWCNGDFKKLTKYCTKSSNGIVDNKTTLDLEDDAAYVHWGSNWRIPTFSEIEELLTYTTSEWTSLNGVNGRKFTSKINSNSIFLPASGVRYGSWLNDESIIGYYWSSSLKESNPVIAHNLIFGPSGVDTDYFYGREYGRSVRPVLR